MIRRLAPVIPDRVPSLDGLRAVSVVFVLIGHAADTRNAPALLRPFSHFGNIGVRFFFVISGLLITTLLLKELDKHGRISLRQFYFRRTVRIFPASYFYIACMFAATALGIIAVKRADFVHAVTYTMNYHTGWGWYLQHLWSLSVEEQFYLLWPSLLLLAGPARSTRGVLVVIALAPILRALMWYGGYPSPRTTTMREFQAVCDALATGCALSLFFNRIVASDLYRRYSAAPWIPIAAGCALVLANASYIVSEPLFYIAGQTACNLSVVVLLLWCVQFPHTAVGRILNWAPMVFVGALSYSLYLWQEPFLNAWQVGWATTFPQNILFTFMAALFSYYVVEQPFLRLKKYASTLFSRPNAARAATADSGISPVR